MRRSDQGPNEHTLSMEAHKMNTGLVLIRAATNSLSWASVSPAVK